MILMRLFLHPPKETKIGLMLERENYSQLIRYVCEASVRDYEETLDCLSQAIKAGWQDPDNVMKSVFHADPYEKNFDAFSRDCAKNRTERLERRLSPREVAEITLSLVERKRSLLKEKWCFIDFSISVILGILTFFVVLSLLS
jgi:hypothetical protein